VDSNAQRQFLMERYTGDVWKRKVIKMSDAQVHAIFMRINTRRNNKENKR